MINAPHTEKSEECDFCGWETKLLHEVDAYARTPGHGPFTPDDQKQWAWLCDICYSTPAGNAHRYPALGDYHLGTSRSPRRESSMVLQMLAACTNRILAAIAKEQLGEEP